MAPRKLVKENEMEEVKPARVLRARPQVVTTNVDLDDQSQATEKKVRAKKNVQTEKNVKTTATKATGNAKAKSTPKPKKVAAKGHKLPEPIKPGEIFIDCAKKSWRVGKSLGSGGFGEVYSATDDVNDSKVDEYKYCMKVEYSTGPLFVEQHFYLKCAKPEHLTAWKKEKKLKVLGLPAFYAMRGQQEHNGKSYRFIIISKFGQDLQHLLEEHKKFSIKNTLTVGCSLLDTLEYIHHCGYVHADLKPANILLSVDSSQAVVNIVDFGLATKYMDTENNHKKHIVEKKAAHNGTLIYTSCIAHRGAVTTSRICDIEILAYNLLHLVTGSLPWQPFEKTPDKVLQMKETLLKDPKAFLSTHYNIPVPDVFVDLFKHIYSLKFDSVPDYNKLKTMFTKAIQKAGHKFDGKLNFSETDGETGEASGETENIKKKVPAKKKAPAKKTAATDDEEQDQVDTEIHFDEEALRHVNTARRRVKEVEKPKEPKEKPKGKNIKEDESNIPTQAMLGVMNIKKNKTTGRKKKPEEMPVEEIEISDEEKEDEVPPKRIKKVVQKVYPAKRKETQTLAEVPTPAMLEYLNKKKKNPEAGTKENGESERDLEMKWSSGKPDRKKMKDSKNPNETKGFEPTTHDLTKITDDSEGENHANETFTINHANKTFEIKHPMNETFTIEKPDALPELPSSPSRKRKLVGRGKIKS